MVGVWVRRTMVVVLWVLEFELVVNGNSVCGNPNLKVPLYLTALACSF